MAKIAIMVSRYYDMLQYLNLLEYTTLYYNILHMVLLVIIVLENVAVCLEAPLPRLSVCNAYKQHQKLKARHYFCRLYSSMFL